MPMNPAEAKAIVQRMAAKRGMSDLDYACEVIAVLRATLEVHSETCHHIVIEGAVTDEPTERRSS
jgi:hypothetical protein